MPVGPSDRRAVNSKVDRLEDRDDLLPVSGSTELPGTESCLTGIRRFATSIGLQSDWKPSPRSRAAVRIVSHAEADCLVAGHSGRTREQHKIATCHLPRSCNFSLLMICVVQRSPSPDGPDTSARFPEFPSRRCEPAPIRVHVEVWMHQLRSAGRGPGGPSRN